MCKLNENYTSDDFIGFKIVAKHKNNHNYYSLATGIQYINDKKIMAPKDQRVLGGGFRYGFLIPTDGAFRELMVGRTAVFRDYQTAKIHFNKWQIHNNFRYTTQLVVAKVYDNLIAGYYEIPKYTVVAGRKIHILGEVL